VNDERWVVVVCSLAGGGVNIANICLMATGRPTP